MEKLSTPLPVASKIRSADEVDLREISQAVGVLKAADVGLGGADIVGIQHGDAGPAILECEDRLVHDRRAYRCP